MAKLNKKPDPVYTHGGAKTQHINPELQLRRSVMSCLLWEGEFYEGGVTIAEKICSLIPKVKPEIVRDIAIVAREQSKLRHVPLLIVREMAKLQTHKPLVGDTLSRVIQRPDELTEFLSIYWQNGRYPLSAQIKKGLALAFNKFNGYSLAKYNRDEAIKLRDVLFLCHAKPQNNEQEKLWKDLIGNKLELPLTWEVQLPEMVRMEQLILVSKALNKSIIEAEKWLNSKTKVERTEIYSKYNKELDIAKKNVWERLLKESKLGALALIRNLRNMNNVGVPLEAIKKALNDVNVSRVLPFRFITAAKYNPDYEEYLERALFRCIESQKKLLGKTILIVDVSGSMYNSYISGKSELNRAQVACSLAILAREYCEDIKIYATAGNDGTRIHQTQKVPARRGFALSDVVYGLCKPLGGGGIFLKQVMDYVKTHEKTADRIIVITDEQDCDVEGSPNNADTFGGNNYLINVASYKNGIGYGKWVHVDGWSESVINYIREYENKGIN